MKYCGLEIEIRLSGGSGKEAYLGGFDLVKSCCVKKRKKKQREAEALGVMRGRGRGRGGEGQGKGKGKGKEISACTEELAKHHSSTCSPLP